MKHCKCGEKAKYKIVIHKRKERDEHDRMKRFKPKILYLFCGKCYLYWKTDKDDLLSGRIK